MPSGRYRSYSWFALLGMLSCLLSPAATLAQNRAITLQGDGGDAWTFEKNLEGDLPDGGCEKVLVASPRATVEAWQAEGRFGAVVPLLEGDNAVRAICRLETGLIASSLVSAPPATPRHMVSPDMVTQARLRATLTLSKKSKGGLT